MRSAPHVTVARDRLPDQVREDIVREVGVVFAKRAGIALGEQVKAEPVVGLAQKFASEGTRLLRDKHRTKVLLSPFFHPLYVRAGVVQLSTEYTLRFLDNGDGRDDRFTAGEIFLVMGKELSEKKASKHVSRGAAEETDIDDNHASSG